MNEEGKTQQKTGHRGPIEASYPPIGDDEISAKQNHRSAGIGPLYLCERKKIDNDRDSGEVGGCVGTRTQKQEER